AIFLHNVHSVPNRIPGMGSLRIVPNTWDRSPAALPARLRRLCEIRTSDLQRARVLSRQNSYLRWRARRTAAYLRAGCFRSSSRPHFFLSEQWPSPLGFGLIAV